MRLSMTSGPTFWLCSWRLPPYRPAFWGPLVERCKSRKTPGRLGSAPQRPARLRSRCPHWLAFRLFHLLLPLARTAVYLAPALTLLIAATAAISAPSRAAVWNRRILVGWLGLTSFYFLACLRLTWFKEWREQADVDEAYSFVVNCVPGQFAQEAIAAPQYRPSLVFYRHLYGSD